MTYRTERSNSSLFDSMTIWRTCWITLTAAALFDPIAVGRFSEQLIAPMGVNNPVREVWDQAQLVWGPEPFESKIKCLVSIGAGVLTSKHLRNIASSTS
jgi:hypothetical protein